MRLTPAEAKEIGEALIDAAKNADTLGIPCDVVYRVELGVAACVPHYVDDDDSLITVTPS